MVGSDAIVGEMAGGDNAQNEHINRRNVCYSEKLEGKGERHNTTQ